jgi:hypothetical protein
MFWRVLNFSEDEWFSPFSSTPDELQKAEVAAIPRFKRGTRTRIIRIVAAL